jgi:hypothetical protein
MKESPMRTEDLINLVRRLATFLKSQGKGVSISEELTAIYLAEAYFNLSDHANYDDITTIILAALAKDDESEALIKEYLSRLSAWRDNANNDLTRRCKDHDQRQKPHYDVINEVQYVHRIPKNPRKLKYVANLLAKLGELRDPRVVAKILEQRPSIALSVGKERSLAAVRYMSAEKAAEVVRKLVANADSYEEALSVARAVDPRLLWRVEIKGFIKGSSLEALVKASLSLRHAAASLSNRELHYLQLAVEESKYAETALSKVNEEELGETARRLLNEAKAIIGVAQGDTSSLADLPLEVLIPVVQDLYINTEDVKERRALERLLELSLTGIAGLYQGKRTTYNAVGGRLDLRRSELKYIRMVNNFMTYRRREKAKNFSLLLDISGSMRPYSSMALAAAALATDSIDLLVLFNDTVKLVKGPLKRQTMIRLLASLRFDGYTNISQALRASETAKRAVIISDLRQTVRDLEPSEAICSFISKGRRLALLAPPSATLAEISKIQGCGASVVTVSGQSDVIRAFSKILRKV